MDVIERDEATTNNGLAGVSLPEDVFTDQVAFIKLVRKGISGKILQQAIKVLNDRELFVNLLETNSGNLHRYYKRKALSRGQSEEVLDTLRLYYQASKIFGDPRVARQWLHCEVPALSGSRPVDLLDTFQGRDLVREVLGKIEYGEFS